MTLLKNVRASNTDRLAVSGMLAIVALAVSSQVNLSSHAGKGGRSEAESRSLQAVYNALPLVFEANRGQSDPQVRFLTRGRGYALLLTETEAVLRFNRPPVTRDPRSSDAAQAGSAVVSMRLVAANPHPRVEGADPLPTRVTYLVGNNPQAWQAGVPTFAKVRYREIYSGVDLVYYGNQEVGWSTTF